MVVCLCLHFDQDIERETERGGEKRRVRWSERGDKKREGKGERRGCVSVL
jgi:hypothetical protein